MKRDRWYPKDATNPEHLLKYFAQGAQRAPSWYNTQPWRVYIDGHNIELYLDLSKSQEIFDWGQYNSLIACGCAIYNIRVLADSYGYGPEVELFLPSSRNNNMVARLKFNFNVAPSKKDATFEDSVWQRHTNTLLFENSTLDEKVLQQLSQSVSKYSQIRLQLFTREDEKQKIFSAISCADQVRFLRKDLHQYLHNNIRWSESAAKSYGTGLTLPSMGVCGFGKFFFRATRPWFLMNMANKAGSFKNLSERANNGFKHCGAVGILSMKEKGPLDLMRLGESIESLWLMATQLEMELQPHTVLNIFHWIYKIDELQFSKIFDAQQKEILYRSFELYSNAFPDIDFAGGEMGHFLFRIGEGPEALGYTQRKEN